jgi:hypothetical protein
LPGGQANRCCDRACISFSSGDCSKEATQTFRRDTLRAKGKDDRPRIITTEPRKMVIARKALQTQGLLLSLAAGADLTHIMVA